MPDDRSPGWWRDEWGAWHGPVEDHGDSGPHEHRERIPPHLRVLPPGAEQDAVHEAERIIAAPPGIHEAMQGEYPPVLPTGSGMLATVPEGKVASAGVWVGGVWQERPPRPKVGPVAGLRLYLAKLREALEDNEP